MKLRKVLAASMDILLVVFTSGCAREMPSTPMPGQTSSPAATEENCPFTPSVIAQPKPDAAVQGTIPPGAYIINENQTIWVGAWWTSGDGSAVTDDPDGVKMGWFRPAGETLSITGRRLDAPAEPLKVEVPCCYPTRFQPSGLFFPSPGCWEVTGRAGDEMLKFVLQVEPSKGKR